MVRAMLSGATASPALVGDIAPTRESAQASPRETTCDGVVCYAGVDWWYHNRGHSECQIMQRLARRCPVLWINTLGMRAPSPGKTELVWRRYARKLRSTLRGLKRDAASGMWVYSPIFIPRYTEPVVRLNGLLVAAQVALLLRHLGIRRPSAWVTVPTAWPAMRRNDSWVRTVFNRSDDFSRFPEADASLIAPLERSLLRACDNVVYVNHGLMGRETHLCRDARFLGHGVDYDHFANARLRPGPAPEALRDLPRPIVGFYGALDTYTIDLELMVKAARRVRQQHGGTLLVIGPAAMDISRLLAEPNVRYLGPVPYKDLPAYAACFDAGLMPWLRNEWIQACNPIKLKEYLALGFPIVSTEFPELAPYRELVYPSRTHEEFLNQIGRALAETNASLAARRRESVRRQTWDALTEQAAEMLGVGPGGEENA